MQLQRQRQNDRPSDPHVDTAGARARRAGVRTWGRGFRIPFAWLTAGLLSIAFGAGCATQGDFLRLQEQVAEHHRPRKREPDPFARIAQLSADVDALQQQLATLRGEMEIARKEAQDALAEARRIRTALAEGKTLEQPSPEDALDEGLDGAETASQDGEVGGPMAAAALGSDGASTRNEELAGYQNALDAWRSEDFAECMNRFTGFLQAYPTSGYADDAAYWLADCTYRSEDFKRAVVRFNAVVSVYPESPKAPDALYRQGESLLKLGPKFHEAARTVFRRVQKDYPSSERAVEAAQQLDRLGTDGESRG